MDRFSAAYASSFIDSPPIQEEHLSRDRNSFSWKAVHVTLARSYHRRRGFLVSTAALIKLIFPASSLLVRTQLTFRSRSEQVEHAEVHGTNKQNWTLDERPNSVLECEAPSGRQLQFRYSVHRLSVVRRNCYSPRSILNCMGI